MSMPAKGNGTVDTTFCATLQLKPRYAGPPTSVADQARYSPGPICLPGVRASGGTRRPIRNTGLLSFRRG